MKQEALTLETVSEITVFETSTATAFVAAIKEKVSGIVFDMDDPKERKACRSLANDISKSKVRLRELANGAKAEAKAVVDGVTTAIIQIEKDLDQLRDETKQPAVDWTRNEDARKRNIHRHIDTLEVWGRDLGMMNVEALQERLDSMKGEMTFDFQELSEEAKLIEAETRSNLTNAIAAEEKRLAEAKAEQDRIQKLETENKRLQAIEDKRLEAEAKAAQGKADKDAADARKEQARLDRIEADKREKQRKLDEDKRIKDAELKAIADEKERARLEKEDADRKAEEDRKAIELEESKRIANQAHRTKVRTKVTEFISEKLGISLHKAIELTNAVEDGENEYLAINF